VRPKITETEWPSRVWARIACTTGVFAITAILADRSAACVQALVPVCIMTARSIAQILSWLGMDSHREMATLIHLGGFGYEIGFTCTGIIPAGLLAIAILAAGGGVRARVWGAAIGAVGVLLLNLVRLVSLFYIGVLAPRFFAAVHSIVWQALTVLFVVGFFYAWKSKVRTFRQRLRLMLHPTACSIRE
jgi:exosortase/archaeosortase family protein